MGFGQLIPYKTGEKASYTCPRCWGDGCCPVNSEEDTAYPPICEGCGGRGMVSKKRYDEIIEDGDDTLFI